MQRLAAGDDQALDEIIQRWQDRLMSFLWHMTHDYAAARDLAQETFVRLYQHRHRYRPSAAFPSYLFRIARNLLANHQRWQARHPAQSLEAVPLNGAEPVDDRSPAGMLEEKETALQVRRAIRTLPADLRETLILATYQSLGYREISQLLDCSEKAVETRLYRARALLKEKLAPLVSAS